MCKELTHDGRLFEVGYKAVRHGRKLGSVLVTLDDVTERTAARLAARQAAETQAILASILRDARGFGRNLDELRLLAAAVRDPNDAVSRARSLHTLKGNAAILGLTQLGDLCHELESHVDRRDADEAITEQKTRAIDDELARIVSLVRELAGDGALERIELPTDELTRVIALLERGGSSAAALGELRRWMLVPVTRPLSKLAGRARDLGRQLGKDIDVVVDAGDVRVDPDALEPLWAALAHAVGNAVDHGIEPESTRVAQGRPARGRIRLSAATDASGLLVVEVADDGAGVDFEAVREAAKRRGLPCGTMADLHDALFSDALSTRSEVTSTSGRGVGLAALRETCVKLGGTVEIETQQGIGTCVRVRVPLVRPREP
jgi:two-component system chemotaxis sensor kinase CheA